LGDSFAHSWLNRKGSALNPYLESGVSLPRNALDDDEEIRLAAFLYGVFGPNLDAFAVHFDMELRDLWGFWGEPQASGAATAHRGSRMQWNAWVLTRIRTQFGVTPSEGVNTTVGAVIHELGAHHQRQLRRPH
jgi:hypothetical protein